MDTKQFILIVTGIIIRAIAWVLVAKLGYDATEANTAASGIGNGLAAAVVGVLAVWQSYRRLNRTIRCPTVILQHAWIGADGGDELLQRNERDYRRDEAVYNKRRHMLCAK